jgi:hypothetical protein
MNDDWEQFPPIEGNGVPDGGAVGVLVAVVSFVVTLIGLGVAVGRWLI